MKEGKCYQCGEFKKLGKYENVLVCGVCKHKIMTKTEIKKTFLDKVKKWNAKIVNAIAVLLKKIP